MALLVLLTSALTGCAGQRHSYENLIDSNTGVIHLQQGDRKEALAVGNGFPGWWGYYPHIFSNDPDIASIECEAARSVIPFRKPGLIFGGERCYIHANSVGETWIVQGNKYSNMSGQTDDQYPEEHRIRVVISLAKK